MKQKTIFLMLMAFMLFVASKCDDAIIKNQAGTFKDISGMGGCSFIIELDSGGKIDPMNFSEFSIVPTDGAKVVVSYAVDSNAMSTCMVGTPVQIIKIEEKD